MIGRGWVVAAVALVGGLGAGALATVVPAAEGECDSMSSTTGYVIVSCDASGGDVTVPGGRTVTVELAGGSGGNAGDQAGGPGAVVNGYWVPDADTVVRVAPGSRGADGHAEGEARSGGGGGGGSWILLPVGDGEGGVERAPDPWLFVAGGGGGAGLNDSFGGAGAGGTPSGGNGGGGATGATLDGPGAGSGGGAAGKGTEGGEGVYGGGSGGSGYYGGGAGGEDGGGGGGGSSYAGVGDAFYTTASLPGDGWARLSWRADERTPPAFTSAPSAAFVAGTPGSFTVSATGTPAPALQLADGALPPGLTFIDDGDGHAVISGVPAAGYGATSVVTLRAANGVEPDATQQLAITVTVPPGPPPTDPPPAPPFTPDFTAGQTTETQQDPDLVPVADETVVVTPVSGTVLIRRPNGEVTELKAGEVIPIGSIIDARNGVVRLTAARDQSGVVQTAIFWNAIFKVTQQADGGAGGRARAAATAPKKLLTELTLTQHATGCNGRARAAAGKKAGGLWGDGKGRFRVRGESSAATVRGTKWYVENRCEGTYTRVVRGIVAVNDFVKRKTIILRAGGTYTAKPRKRG